MDATTAILGWFRGRDEQEVGRVEISEVMVPHVVQLSSSQKAPGYR